MFELLEDRSLLAVTLASNYTGMDILAGTSGGFISTPPDTCGAAGATGYVETVNQGLRIYSDKASGGTFVNDSFNDFWFTRGGLARASANASLSDPIVVWDDLAQRFIVGDQDVDDSSHASTFDIAVSKTASPATLTTADWDFYQIDTSESNYDADYPGNFGYNHDAFVFTLNQIAVVGFSSHVQVNTVSISDLLSGTLTYFQNDINTSSLRPVVMHDSVAGDPMWLVAKGSGSSINVVKMTNVLSNSASFTTTNLHVNSFSAVVAPKQPDGTTITTNVDTRIIKAAEWNDTIVASHAIGVSATEDDARWYAIDVSSGTPTLADQGNVSAGNNHYIVYPSVDINAAGDIGMTYLQSGTGAGQYMSMYVTGRNAADVAGTMQTPVLVKAGVANEVGGREGDLSGINTDSNGTFWAVNEWAANPAQTSTFANWSTAIANFVMGAAPVITPPSDQSATVGVSTGFNLGSFVDTDGGPWSVTVDWGDGAADDAFNVLVAGSLGSSPHNYAAPGIFTVTVTVQDSTSLLDTKTFHANVTELAQVVGRYVFYNDSAFDGNSDTNDASDDNAIPSNKTAYLPGDGQMVLASITNFSRGINGVMVDLTVGSADHTTINASDFVFKVGANNSPDTWTTLTATPTISVRTGAGVSGSDRVDITWNNNAIQDEYLEVQVLATAHTGLGANFGFIDGNLVGDIFFFGNLRGETASVTPGGAFARSLSADGNPIVAAGVLTSVGIDSFLDVDRSNSITLSGDRNPIVAGGVGSMTRISIGAAGPFAPQGGGSSGGGDAGISSGLTATSTSSSSSSSTLALPASVATRLDSAGSTVGVVGTYSQLLDDAGAAATDDADDAGLDDETLDSIVEGLRAG